MLLIPRGRVVPRPCSRLVHVGGGPFCSFHQEPAICVEQPDDDRDMPTGAHAPATWDTFLCYLLGPDLPSPRAPLFKPTPFYFFAPITPDLLHLGYRCFYCPDLLPFHSSKYTCTLSFTGINDDGSTAPWNQIVTAMGNNWIAISHQIGILRSYADRIHGEFISIRKWAITSSKLDNAYCVTSWKTTG